jgi:putative transposase
MSNLDYKGNYRRCLPHLQPLGATFFLTFRLADSLPRFVIEQWKAEKRQFEARKVAGLITDDEITEYQRRRFARLESYLHQAIGSPTWLKEKDVAEMLVDALHHRDSKVYRLDAYCVMPNHVHAIFAPLPEVVEATATEARRQGELPEYYSLAKIMHSLKSYTANQANKVLGRSGAFWEHESYDHYVRDEPEWYRTIEYVLNNPLKAHLVKDFRDWPWSYNRLQW